MPREIRLNAFVMNTVGHMSPGLWTHPRDRTADYRHLSYWTGLAQMLERGLFDGMFVADVLGVYDVFGGGPEAALRHATQVPVNDPLMLVPAMAQATTHIGFGVTCNLTWELPYPFARRMSTLDHLTGGRIGWNIVTGYLDSAARAMGRERQTAHDERYDVAEEYMDVVYKLWEGSWEDDAVVRDRAGGTFTRPEKVHRIVHRGDNYTVDAIHLCEPSPQRTPVLYQAGSSTKGRTFAARHAECVFLSGPSATVIGERVAGIRGLAAEAGRDPRSIAMFSLVTVIVGRTGAEARAKHDEYRRHVSRDGALALMSGWTGVDLSTYRHDQEIRYIENDAGRSAMENVTRHEADRVWTVGAVAEHVAIGGQGPVIVGAPADVCDALEGWMEQTDVDGFNLAFAVSPDGYADFIELVVPELQRRGRYKTAYRPGTLREKLSGGRAHLPDSHPGRRHRYRVG